jgi:hypothetical protein
MTVREGKTLEGLRLYGHVEAPRALFSYGTVTSTGERFIAIGLEQPQMWHGLVDASKEDREWTQVHRFLRDHERAVGKRLAVDVDRPGIHPDFRVRQADGRTIGLECTQLVYGDRLAAWRSVEELKAQLLEVDPQRLRHLQGHSVYLTVQTANHLPPAGKLGVEEVADALGAFQPIHNDFADTPANLSGTNIVQKFQNDKYLLTAVPLTIHHERTALVERRGFELTVAIEDEVLAAEGWALLDKRIQDKDLPGADIVLVSCGAPVHGGLSFPSDELAAETIALSAPDHALSPRTYVKAVYLHAWDTERLIRLIPGHAGADYLTGQEPIGTSANAALKQP